MEAQGSLSLSSRFRDTLLLMTQGFNWIYTTPSLVRPTGFQDRTSGKDSGEFPSFGL